MVKAGPPAGAVPLTRSAVRKTGTIAKQKNNTAAIMYMAWIHDGQCLAERAWFRGVIGAEETKKSQKLVSGKPKSICFKRSLSVRRGVKVVIPYAPL
jgi:hypothetical protein